MTSMPHDSSLLGLLVDVISNHVYTLGNNNEILELLKDHGQLGSLIISRIVKRARVCYWQVLCQDCEALFVVDMEAGEFPHIGFFRCENCQARHESWQQSVIFKSILTTFKLSHSWNNHNFEYNTSTKEVEPKEIRWSGGLLEFIHTRCFTMVEMDSYLLFPSGFQLKYILHLPKSEIRAIALFEDVYSREWASMQNRWCIYRKRHAETRKIVDKFKKQTRKEKSCFKVMLWDTIIFQLRCSEHVKTCESCFTCQSLKVWRTLSYMPRPSYAFRMQ